MLTARIFVLAMFVAALSVTAARSQDDADVDMLTDRADRFFENLASPTVLPLNAFSDLLLDGPLAGKTEQLNAFVEEYNKLEGRYGRFLQARLVNVKRIDSDLIVLTYLYKCQEYPVVWRFTYYRPPSEAVERARWRVVRLSFDSKLEGLANLSGSGT